MAETIQRNFTGGILDPALHVRSDITKYQSGLADCLNFIVREQGGLVTRPGTEFIDQLDNPNLGSLFNIRMIPFDFGMDQTYVVIFSHELLYFVRDGGFVQFNGGRYSIKSPYAVDDVPDIKYAQDADVLTLTHPDYPPHNLKRFGDNDWRIEQISFVDKLESPVPEFQSVNIQNFTINNSSTFTAELTGTSSSLLGYHAISNVPGIPNFPPGVYLTTSGSQVNGNTAYQFRGADLTGVPDTYTTGGTTSYHGRDTQGDIQSAGDFNKTYCYRVTAIDAEERESFPSDVVCFWEKSLSSTYGIKIKWNRVPGAIRYRVYKDVNDNSGNYGWIGNSDTTSFVDYNTAPLLSDGLPAPSNIFNQVKVDITFFDRVTGAATMPNHGLEVGDTGELIGFKDKFFNNPVSVKDVEVASVQDEDNLTFNVAGRNLDSASIGFGSLYYFSNPNGNPGVVSYYQQRRMYAAAGESPQTIYASKPAQYDSFETTNPSRPDDAISLTLAGRKINRVRHLVDMDGLIAFTQDAIWRISDGEDQVFTPATASARIKSYRGASDIRPVTVDDTLVYVDSKELRLRDIKYNYAEDGFSGTDLSVLASHLVTDPLRIKKLAYSDEPYRVIWVLTNDGNLLGLTYNKEQQVWGWHRHNFTDTIIDITTIREDDRDTLYLTFYRPNSSAQGYSICVERMSKLMVSRSRTNQLDSHLKILFGTFSRLDNLDHLEGREVTVAANGISLGQFTVTNGAVDLGGTYGNISVGLSYTASMETLEFDANSTTESLRNKRTSVSRIVIDFYESRAGYVGFGQANGDFDMQEIRPRQFEDNYDTVAPRTYKQEVTASPKWVRGGKIKIEQRDPFPMTILAVAPDVDVS